MHIYTYGGDFAQSLSDHTSGSNKFKKTILPLIHRLIVQEKTPWGTSLF